MVKNERLMYAEVLRIFAMLAVIVVHVAAKEWYRAGVATFEWKTLNFYDSLVRWCVPVFVMLSGMFMLDPAKPISVRTLFGKNIWRIVTAFLFWSLAYIAYDVATGVQDIAWDPATRGVLAEKFFFGRYHLWFLFMIIGLYAITPILRKVAEDRKATEYFLWLAFVFAVLVPSIRNIPGTENFIRFANKFSVQLPLGYAGYYLAGYYLKTYDIGARRRWWIYALGILGAACTVYFTDRLSVNQGKPYGVLYGYLVPNVMLPSVAVFVFFKYGMGRIEFSERAQAWIVSISSCTFGIYLVHDLFNQWFREIGFRTTLFSPVLSVPAITAVTFVVSLAVIFLVAKIPILRKYIL